MNTKKLLRYALGIIYIAGLCFGSGQLVQAEETTESAPAVTEGGFSYEVVHPENQLSNVGYFDLRMTPGQQQTVQINLKNTSSKEVNIGVSLNSAKTNDNGVIEYGPNELVTDASMKYEFTDVVKGPERVTLGPGETKPLELAITMPDASYDGYISGGIQLVEEETEDQKANQTGMIVNKYAYVIGLQLTETDQEVTPDLTLNTVSAGLQNYRNAIYVNYSNTEANYLNGMTTEVQISKADSDKVLYDTKKSNMRMAPNSVINFPVSMNGERMVAGDYKAKILVTSEDGGRWEWEQAFTITDEEADKFNQEDVGLIQDRGIDWKLIAMIVGGAVAVLVLVFVAVRWVRKKNQAKKRPNKKKKPVKKGKK